MKKQSFKKLVSLLTLVGVMSTISVLPLQAATLTETTPKVATLTMTPKTTPQTTLNSIVHPMDPIQSWTESTQFRTNTNTWFQSLEQSVVTSALLWLLKIPNDKALLAGVATAFANYWGGVGSHTGYEAISYFWCPSNIPYSPYYVKKHINYYADSSHTQFLAATDEYYYSTQPY